MKYVTLMTLLFLSTNAYAEPKDFNKYILKSIETIVSKRAGGGYDINSVLTQNISYGTDTIKATNPPKTMCVAAVMEIILEAINLYREDGHSDVTSKVPAASWQRGQLGGLRANLFMYRGTGSRGTAGTLARFEMGQELPFSSLKKGDFINFNRTTNHGHAVVFLGFVSRALQVSDVFSRDTVGFKYFSAQGKGRQDAGMGYRLAFFNGFCPDQSSIKGIVRDCKVIRADNSQVVFNAGRMFDPSVWNYDAAQKQIKEGLRQAFAAQFPDQSRGFLDDAAERELTRELPAVIDSLQPLDGIDAD